MTELYKDSGLQIYEKAHYSHGEHIKEVEQILTWYTRRNAKILDIGCSAGLHALEFAERGYSVTGVDIENSAIELARKRAVNENLKAKFSGMDIEKNSFAELGKFDFIYSLGNVLSHVKKDNIFKVLKKLRARLCKKSILLFDVLINAKPFQEKLYPKENDPQIIWKRKINEKTGLISMDGIFLGFDFTQHFEVWGYEVDEVIRMLNVLGFKKIDFSEKLDFIETNKNKNKNAISLYFRAGL